MMNLVTKLAEVQVLPILTIGDDIDVLALCRALMAGGFRAVEITLRTRRAMAAIRAIKKNFPTLFVAAGTVTTSEQMVAVHEAGADLVISPGITQSLVDKSRALTLPLLPGVSSASEILLGQEMDLNCFKQFPAHLSGGKAWLQAMTAPFPDARFCPTGGLDSQNFTDFLASPNVVCVGGSWMVDEKYVARQNWSRITQMAEDTMRQVQAWQAAKK